jgi:nucleotide-binding universal stress UspA family protein
MEITMPFKDIAVLLETDAKVDVATPFAISFAAAMGAHLTGVGIAIEMIVPTPIMSEIPGDVFAAAFARAKLEAKDASTRFERDAKLAGVPNTGHLIAATADMADDEFSGLARHFDITVLQQPNPDSLGDEEVLIEAALFRSGRPVLVIPYTHKAVYKCDRVVVAWDGSVPAVRAIASAMPLLQSARSVELVTVSEKKKNSDVDLPGFNITRHLARHAINAELRKLPSAGDIANTLLSHLADNEADLLVMGAYGHSRLREFILGGATRGILSAMTSPVLMAH